STGTVASNTATTITLTANWTGGTPAASSSYTIFGSLKDTSLNLVTDQLAGLPVVAITPAVTGTASYTSLTGTGANVTYGTNTRTDTGASFPSLVGKTVVVGDVSGVVQSNNATTITLTANWSPSPPVNGATYVIATLTDATKTFTSAMAGR